MKKIVCSILAMVMIVVCVGCGSDKKPAQESKKPTTTASRETETVETPEAPAPAEPATPTITDEEPEIIGSADDIVAWRYNFNHSQFLVDKGKCFIVSCESKAIYSKIICLDSKTGEKYWDNNFLYGWKLIAGETGIIVYDPNNNVANKYGVICFDIDTGEKIFEITEYNYIISCVTLNNHLYFTTSDCSLHCYDIRTGECLWIDKMVARFNANLYSSSDKIFCAFDKTLSCFDAQDGRKLWTVETVENACNPMILDGKVYFNAKDSASWKNTFYCLDLQTGIQEWLVDLSPRTAELFVDQNKALLFDHCDSLYIYYDFSEKKEIWSIYSIMLRSPIIIRSNLHLLINNQWSIVDMESGKIVKNLGLAENYYFAQNKIYTDTNEYFQCVVPGNIITDNMFENKSGKSLQKIYSNNSIQVSSYPSRPSEIVYGFTMEKKLWQTPKDWDLKQENFPGMPKSYFWIVNDNKVLVKRRDKNAYFYTCLDKSTGEKLWEIPKENYRIDGYEDGILKLHSIKNNRQITIADGSIKDDQPKTFDKLIVFEATLPRTKGFHRYGWVYDLTDSYYLYVAFDATKHPEPSGFCYLINSSNGKIIVLDDKSYIAFDYLQVWKNKDKLFVSKEEKYGYYRENDPSLEIDIKTDISKPISYDDIPEDTVLLGVDKDFEQNKYELDSKTIKKIGVQPYKPHFDHVCYMKGLNYNNYTICQREEIEGFEYVLPYSDYTGVYDAKTLKKLWSYDKKVENIYFHDSTIIINGDWENQVVLFNDLATGKTLLRYDNAAVLSKVGDICFVSSGDKLIAVNLKKLPK